MKIKRIDQRSLEWHAFRKGGIGSSDISIILGSSPYKNRSLLDLYKEKVEDPKPMEDNEAMAYGREQEPIVVEYLKKTNPNLESFCAIHEEYDFIRCSFDAVGTEAIYEIKCPYSLEKLASYLSGNIPEHWKDQVKWQILISGYKKGYLMIWDGSIAHSFEILKDPAWEEKAIKAAIEFWTMVQNFEPPAANYVDIANDQMSHELDEYFKWDQIEKEAIAKKKEFKGSLIAQGPGENFVLDGVKIFQKFNTSYDIDLMRKQGIPVDQYKKKGSPYWMISSKRESSKSL